MKNSLTKVIRRAAALAGALVLAFGLTACGAKGSNITIEVTGPDGATESFSGKTQATTLYDAISDFDGVTIDGYTADWGYYVTTINGIEADYDNDGAYWSVYVNGAYGESTIDAQPIADGDTYSFVYEVYQAAE